MSKSVIVCGGGIIGLSCAYYLAREGWGVTVLERNAEDVDSCAQGSAGYISTSHLIPLSAPGMVLQGLKWMMSSRSPFYIKPRLDPELLRWGWLFTQACTPRHTARAAPVLRDLCMMGRTLFVELAELTDDAFEFKPEGLISLCKTLAALGHETQGIVRIANELGVEARVLNAKQTADLEPGTKLDVAGSVYFPLDAHLTPRKLVPALISLLRQMGVTLKWNASIKGWRTAGSHVVGVDTSAGRLTGDEYVLACGSWSTAMVATLNIRLPMQAGKGYSLTLERPRFRLTKPLMLSECRVAVTPMGDKLRFGGTMEISGINSRIRPERIQQIIDTVPLYCPDFTAKDFEGIKPWFGLRPLSPDGLPYIGRFRGHANLTAACGHAMLGVTMAPSTGLLVAEILSGKRPSIPLEFLSPDRYA